MCCDGLGRGRIKGRRFVTVYFFSFCFVSFPPSSALRVLHSLFCFSLVLPRNVESRIFCVLFSFDREKMTSMRSHPPDVPFPPFSGRPVTSFQENCFRFINYRDISSVFFLIYFICRLAVCVCVCVKDVRLLNGHLIRHWSRVLFALFLFRTMKQCLKETNSGRP